MTTKADVLADKLANEGERVLAYFRQLPADAWTMPVYVEGPGWCVRDAFEHLIISEETLLTLFDRIVREGKGVEEGFNLTAFNAEHTGDLSTQHIDEIATHYTSMRQRTVDFARGLSDEQLAIRARHPALGDSTLEEMIKLIYVHHGMHLRDVKRSLLSI